MTHGLLIAQNKTNMEALCSFPYLKYSQKSFGTFPNSISSYAYTKLFSLVLKKAETER